MDNNYNLNLKESRKNLRRFKETTEDCISTLELLKEFVDPDYNSNELTIAKLGNLKKNYSSKYREVWTLIPELILCIERKDEYLVSSAIELMTLVARYDPKFITEKAEQSLARRLKDEDVCRSVVVFMHAYAENRPDKVIKYERELIDYYKTHEQDVLVAHTLVIVAKTENDRERYILLFVKSLQKQRETDSDDTQLALLFCILELGKENPDVLLNFMTDFQRLRKNEKLKKICDKILHYADPTYKLEEEISKQLNSSTVQLDSESPVVLHYAPNWARDVSEKLGDKWKNLARKLKFSDSKIQKWSKQSEPCLRMLDYYFKKNKVRNGNKKRSEFVEALSSESAAAANDVESSADAIQKCIAGENPSTRPAIFISYQWDHQECVKVLRQRLAYAGYPAWMDINKMGGGDALYDKIAEGIQAAKIIICCLTDKYRESKNCQLEVHFSNGNKKEIIPLLLTKTTWPLSGGIGILLCKLLYIEFYDKEMKGDKKCDVCGSGNGRHWKEEKFKELLQQIQLHLAPDVAAIPKNSDYKDWCGEARQKIAEKDEDFKNKFLKEKSEENAEVFISYHRESEHDAIDLFIKLKKIGFRVWLDLWHMSGGDCLKAKAERAISQSSVMLVCVSENYLTTMTCRDEMEFAREEKKELIFLLLSGGAEGISNIKLLSLAGLNMDNYLGFITSEGKQKRWQGKEFDDLVMRILKACKIEGTRRKEISDSISSESSQQENVIYYEKESFQEQPNVSFEMVLQKENTEIIEVEKDDDTDGKLQTQDIQHAEISSQAPIHSVNNTSQCCILS